MASWKRFTCGAVIAAAITGVSSTASGGEVGLAGPSIWNRDVDRAIEGARAVEETGTAWVRLNFRLDVWTALDETWFAAYDQLVDHLTTHGVQVYALIGAESVPGVDRDPNTDDFVSRYADAFVKIVDHFKDRVRVYETFNEPNNAVVTPFYFAKMQQEIYLATKWNDGRNKDPRNQVTIVSGPVLASDHDSVPDEGALDYLAKVFAAGREQLAWDWMHEHVGRYPLDGVGYHLYVVQTSAGTPEQIAKTLQANVDALSTRMASLDDAAADKRIWLSEFGWNTDPTGEGAVSASQQAQFLTAGFDVFGPDSRVASAFWFTFQDFPAGGFGLFDIDGLNARHRHPSYDAFTASAAKYKRSVTTDAGTPPATREAPAPTSTSTSKVESEPASKSQSKSESESEQAGCSSTKRTSSELELGLLAAIVLSGRRRRAGKSRPRT